MSYVNDKWQPFAAVSEMIWPDTYPFKIEAMDENGIRASYSMNTESDLDKLDDWNIVSIRIYDVHNPTLRFVRNFMADHHPKVTYGNGKYDPDKVREGSLDQHHTTKVLTTIVELYGLV